MRGRSQSNNTDAILIDCDKVLRLLKHDSPNFRLPQLKALVSEYETPLGVQVNIKDHDCEGVDVDGLKTEDQLTTCIVSPVDDDVGVSNIQLVRISHQEPVVVQVTVFETQNVYSQLLVVHVAQDVEILADAVVDNLTDHTNVETDIDVDFLFLVSILEIQID